MADLRATISRLEVDIMKANKAKAEELHAAQEEFTAKLSAEQSKTKAAEERYANLEKRCSALEKQLSQKDDELEEVIETVPKTNEKCLLTFQISLVRNWNKKRSKNQPPKLNWTIF
ncbi:hypothetical protein K449DRAFT_265301 [Hypoxylon sp. EC38]|nr:hypothetical protein K449DRAFT_265301 [Hypoxylon sp. EC38]